MDIDKRLLEIKDCLYRVAVKAVIVHDKKILLVLDGRDTEYTFPGGGIDYGETAEEALFRELKEEVNVQRKDIQEANLIHVISGHEKIGIPRVNIFYLVKSSVDNIQTTDEITAYKWFSIDELKNEKLDPSTGNTDKLFEIISKFIV
ncbi:NUDIX domain-containing protein [Candidatus Saccharibacteria bacterium]|nr:NUDIX domain-containing protein [Candidatus Saccharibacteria bacterium]